MYFPQRTVTTQNAEGTHIYLRDGVHSAIILEFGVILAAFALVLWIRFRQITDKHGRVKCPHCSLRYDQEE